MNQINVPPRMLPEVTAHNRQFWQGGRDGELRILRCVTCGNYLHPPGVYCVKCGGTDLAFEAVSGRGEVYSFTINYKCWIPGFEPPYAIALVELAEQEGLFVTSNVMGAALDHIEIGMKVQVGFEQHGDIYLPVFYPV